VDQQSARRLVAAALVIGLLAQTLLFRTALGLNLVLLVAALVACALILRRPAARLDRLDAWIPLAALTFAAFVAIRADPVLVFVDTLAALGCGAAAVAAIGGAALTRRSLLGLMWVGLRGATLVFGGASEPIVAARPTTGAEVFRRRLGRVAPLLRGLAIAIPVMAIFAGLFAAADAVFSRTLSNVFAIDLDLGEVPPRLILAGVIAWVAAGLLVAVAREVFPPEPRSLGAAAVSPGLALRRLGSTEAIVVLVAVDLLFTAFVALQVAYLFGGRDTLAATGFTYSEYARRGFFELLAVAFLSGGLIAGLEIVVSRRSWGYVLSAVTLAGLTLVVLASATLRLKLYQDAYGWTELRFYVYATIAWLGLGALATAGLLLAGRTRWLAHAFGTLAVVVWLGINAVGPQGFVARQNLARAIDPSLVAPGGQRGLDAWYLASLGDDAVPVMIEAVPYVDMNDLPMLDRQIRDRELALGQSDVTAWPAWNLARQRAREAIERYLSP
jgi:hypothetical protein